MSRQQQRHMGKRLPPQVAANAYTVAQNTVTVTQAMDEVLKPLALESQAHEDAVKIITNTLSLYGWALMALCEKQATIADVKVKTTEFTHTLAQALADATTPAQEAPMYPRIPSNALECASLTVYLKAQGIPATWDSVGVDHGGLMTNAHADAWREAYPTPEAMLTQLRAVVRLILQGSVAA